MLEPSILTDEDPAEVSKQEGQLVPQVTTA